MRETSAHSWRNWRWRRTLAWALVLALLAAALLLLDTAPSVSEQPRPTAEDIAATREAYEDLRRGGPVDITLDNRALRGIASLISDSSGVDRVSAQTVDGVLEAQASIPIIFGIWLNVAARAEGESDGFPDLTCRAGRLSLPPSPCRWAIERGRSFMQQSNDELPSLDTLVKRTEVGRTNVALTLDPPANSGLIGRLIAARPAPIDPMAVRQAYCGLVAQARNSASANFAVIVRQAFAQKGEWDADRMRAAFVAIALLSAGERAERVLVEDPDFPGPACKRLEQKLALHGRVDLAQHWALSAGLAAAYGSRAATSMGEWKELNDSLPAGTGFSFVDLAADRSGVDYARRAFEQGEVGAVLAELRKASAGSLLPAKLLQGPEGLSGTAFAKDFRTLDDTSYRKAVKAIDAELAERNR